MAYLFITGALILLLVKNNSICQDWVSIQVQTPVISNPKENMKAHSKKNLAAGRDEEEPWCVGITDFRSINAPTIANFKLPVCHQLPGKITENLTINSIELYKHTPGRSLCLWTLQINPRYPVLAPLKFSIVLEAKWNLKQWSRAT